jgi:hypothetical protein
MPSGKGRSTLASSGGHIKLYVPESTTAIIEARIRIEGSWETRSKKYDIRSDFTPETYQKDAKREEIRGTFRTMRRTVHLCWGTSRSDYHQRRRAVHRHGAIMKGHPFGWPLVISGGHLS